jgi:hypothetical protein
MAGADALLGSCQEPLRRSCDAEALAPLSYAVIFKLCAQRV